MSMNKFMIHNEARNGRSQMMGNPYGGGQNGNSFPSSTASHVYLPTANPSGKFARNCCFPILKNAFPL